MAVMTYESDSKNRIAPESIMENQMLTGDR